MSFIVTPAPAAADVEAPLTEWSEKIDISILDNLKVSFSHRAMVHETTGLWDFLTATKSWPLSPDHREAITSSYRLKVSTGHKFTL